MKHHLWYLLVLLTSLSVSAQKIDVQGHRGARGMMPENSIPAFIYAVDQGVTTIELDVVVSRDGQIVVSHDPWINPDICLGPDGKSLSGKSREQLNMYALSYEEIRAYDCGSAENDEFPEQQKLYVNKPLLKNVIKQVEQYTRSKTGFEVNYSIEIKSGEDGDNVFHPEPAEFSELVHALIDDYLPWERVIIQSFDFRVLQYWNEHYPEVNLAVLVENMRSIDTNLGALGFVPRIYSPHYKLINEKSVRELHDRGIQVIPWTVNEKEEMQKLVKWGVDGIITDYPNRARELGLNRKYEK